MNNSKNNYCVNIPVLLIISYYQGKSNLPLQCTDKTKFTTTFDVNYWSKVSGKKIVYQQKKKIIVQSIYSALRSKLHR